MKSIFKLFITAILLILASFGGAGGTFAQVTVESKIDSLQILVGEQTGLHVSAIVKKGQKVLFQQYKPEQQIIPGVEVVEAPTVDTTEESNGYIRVTQHMMLTSFEDTIYVIPAQQIKVDGKSYLTKVLPLKVLTVNVDTVHMNQFYGPKDVQDNPFLWEEWGEVLLYAFLAALLYCLCWIAFIRLKSNKPIDLRVRFVKRIPPHQRALNSINKLKSENQQRSPFAPDGEADNSKAYYTQLTDTLRKYIEERFGFNAMEMTSAEIIEQLRKEGDQEKIQELTMLFETADLVKFAKLKVDMNEKDRNLVSAIDFINVTKQENAPTMQRVVPTVTEQQRQTMRLRMSLKWAIAVLIIAASALVAYVCWQIYDLRW